MLNFLVKRKVIRKGCGERELVIERWCHNHKMKGKQKVSVDEAQREEERVV